MPRICQQRVPLEERSQIGEARRMASRLCSDAGVSEGTAGRVAIVATELANNVLRHGGGGEILLQRIGPETAPVIEIVAIDSGPGMDVDRCMADGYSTGGTSGTGLGAVRRQSDMIDVFSRPGGGTVAVARIGSDSGCPEIGAVCLPHPGETLCGDGWQWRRDAEGIAVIVVDGLGHGPQAAHAADVALAAFQESTTTAPTSVLTLAHQRMASTRGGAMAVARVDRRTGTLRYGGIGNIAGALVKDNESRGLLSHNGTVGAQARQIRELDYPCTAGTLLIMHSDGLATRWRVSDYPGLPACHPSTIAAVLYRDYRRTRDDVTVVVMRIQD